MTAAKIRFVNAEQLDFYTILKTRVDDYFTDKNLSRNANALMVFKSVFYIGVLAGSYLLLLLGGFGAGINILLFAVMGLFAAFTGINVSHDAIHGAYSKHKWANKSLSLTFNLLGASDYMWSIMHNIIHHTYTNIQGHDEDIELAPIVRMTPSQPHMKIMKYQHIYIFVLYALTTVSWVFIKDYKKFFQKKIGNYDNKKHSAYEWFNLFFYKIIYYVLFLVLPFALLDMAWWQTLLGFFIMHFIEGYTLALIFVLAHMVEGPQFPMPDEEGLIEDNWAVHQLKTTSDFSRKSKFVSFICGGLNFQIEHHLFPKICHVHYRALSDIVKKTANEFNIPYYEQSTFFGAMLSHIRVVKRLGRPDFAVA